MNTCFVSISYWFQTHTKPVCPTFKQFLHLLDIWTLKYSLWYEYKKELIDFLKICQETFKFHGKICISFASFVNLPFCVFLLLPKQNDNVYGWPREADEELIRNTSLARKQSYIKRSTKQTNGKPHKKPMFFFNNDVQSSILFNVPSLITKVSNNCYTYAIFIFIKRKLSNYDARGGTDRTR